MAQSTRWGSVLAGALALSGCVMTEPAVDSTSATPITNTQPVAAPAQRPIVAPSPASQALAEYYARVQQTYLDQGLLRVDGGGPDTPINARQLAENFIRIALFEEFSNVGGRMVRTETASRLHRWDGPIRMKVHYGEIMPAEDRIRDGREIRSFAARLARLTGLDISLSDRSPNFHVFIVGEDERRRIGPALREISPEIDTTAVTTVENMRRSTLCLVFSIDGEEDGIYETAVAVIRAEHPDLLRLSCIHEELAQGLGLPNDSPLARPSVFNDDEEFGLLTRHDGYLLQMLYDPRLQPGMTISQARPIVNELAREILTDG